MKQVYFVSIHLLIFSFSHLSAQVVANEGMAANSNLGDLSKIGKSLTTTAISFDNRYEGTKGTPLLYKDWQEGQIVLKNGEAVNNKLLININSEESITYANLGAQGFISIENEYIQSVTVINDLGTDKYVSYDQSEIENKKEKVLKLYQQLYISDAYELLKKREIYFQKADYKGAYTNDKRYDEYVLTETYFLKVEGQYYKTKFNTKSISKLIPSLSKLKEWGGTELNDSKLIVMMSQIDQSKK